jgi:hypothetical protein
MITLATLPNASAQEVFDHIVNHLRIQKERCYDSNQDKCVYRLVTPNGDVLRCAAGSLMTAEEYRPEFDINPESGGGTSWPSIVKNFKLSNIHLGLIFDLQRIHDLDDVENWEKRFDEVAQQQGVKYSIS